MDHVAILRKDWKLLPKILSGEKAIESRWYQTKRAPFNKIKEGDFVYFKNSGEMVTAKAKVKKVLQYEIKGVSDLEFLVNKYGDKICLVDRDVSTWNSKIKYCILIFLKEVEKLKKPFNINKKGYGLNSAWLVVGNINQIIVKL
ncbi:MAG: hypothetical protein PHU74_02880 [Candidatus Pacebacteria bacterium]|nr:hypothetical protein [Candidatus Paceibacterota bacterium]